MTLRALGWAYVLWAASSSEFREADWVIFLEIAALAPYLLVLAFWWTLTEIQG